MRPGALIPCLFCHALRRIEIDDTHEKVWCSSDGPRPIEDETVTATHITLCFCCNAAGEAMPKPLAILKLSLIEDFKNSIPANLSFLKRTFSFDGNPKSGWITKEIFVKFLQEVVKPWVEETRVTLGVPQTTQGLFIFDGASQHKGPDVDAAFAACGLKPILLPPNTTHLLQPLDLTIFSPLKTAMKANYKKLKPDPAEVDEEGKPMPYLPRARFAMLKASRDAIQQAFTMTNIESGFARAGFRPWNPKAYLAIAGAKPPPIPGPEKDFKRQPRQKKARKEKGASKKKASSKKQDDDAEKPAKGEKPRKKARRSRRTRDVCESDPETESDHVLCLEDDDEEEEEGVETEEDGEEGPTIVVQNPPRAQEPQGTLAPTPVLDLDDADEEPTVIGIGLPRRA